MWQFADNPTPGWQIYETEDQAPACWYLSTLAGTRGATRLDPYLLGAKQEMVADSLTKALSSAQKHDSFVKMIGIQDQRDLLASIKREQNVLQRLQTDHDWSEVYGFGVNATWYIQGCFC